MSLLFLIGLITWQVAAADYLFEKPFGCCNVAVDNGLNEQNQHYNAFLRYTMVDIANRVASPVSAFMTVSQASLGAQGLTRQEMERALMIPGPLSKANGLIQQLANTLMSYSWNTKEVQFYMSNKMFISNSFNLRSDFMTGMKTFFGAEPMCINMRNPYELANVINQWSGSSTNERMNNIVAPLELRPDADVVLMSIAYFKGNFKTSLHPWQTMSMPYAVHGYDSRNVQATVSFGTFRTGAISALNAKFIELPLNSPAMSDGLSMIVIHPKHPGDLVTISQQLDKININEIRKTQPSYATVKLPKFSIQTTIDISKPFAQLGITEIFGLTPDLRGIADNIRVVQGVQKVHVEIDDGTSETAKSLAILKYAQAIAPEAPEFAVNSPFIFMIVNKEGLIILNGIVSSPSQSTTETMNVDIPEITPPAVDTSSLTMERYRELVELTGTVLQTLKLNRNSPMSIPKNTVLQQYFSAELDKNSFSAPNAVTSILQQFLVKLATNYHVSMNDNAILLQHFIPILIEKSSLSKLKNTYPWDQHLTTTIGNSQSSNDRYNALLKQCISGFSQNSQSSNDASLTSLHQTLSGLPKHYPSSNGESLNLLQRYLSGTTKNSQSSNDQYSVSLQRYLSGSAKNPHVSTDQNSGSLQQYFSEWAKNYHLSTNQQTTLLNQYLSELAKNSQSSIDQNTLSLQQYLSALANDSYLSNDQKSSLLQQYITRFTKKSPSLYDNITSFLTKFTPTVKINPSQTNPYTTLMDKYTSSVVNTDNSRTNPCTLSLQLCALQNGGRLIK